MHPWRLIAIVGAVFSLLAMALPFATLPVIGALGGFEAAAWPALIPQAPVVLAAVFGDWDRGLRPAAAISLLVPASASVLFAVVKASDAMLAVRGTADSSLGAGGLVLLAGTFVCLAGTAASLVRA